MKQPDELCVTFRFTHACGQVFEQIYQLDPQQDYVYAFTSDPISPDSARTEQRMLRVQGQVKSGKQTGVKWHGTRGQVCQTCGESLFSGGER